MGSSCHEDGHELWMCLPALGAESTSLHRNYVLCSTSLTDTELNKSMLCSLKQSPGDTARRAAVFLRSLGLQGGSWCCGDGMARKRRNPSGQLVREWFPTHSGPGSRRTSGSGQVVLSIWDSAESQQAAAPGMPGAHPSIPLSTGGAAQSKLL